MTAAVATWTLPAVLTHDVASAFDTRCHAAGEASAPPSSSTACTLDASALVEFDSSALAVVLECRRQAAAAGYEFSVAGLPPKLKQLAILYGVEGLLVPSSLV